MTPLDLDKPEHFATRRPMEQAFRAFLGAALREKAAVLAAPSQAACDVVQQRLLERYETESANLQRRVSAQEAGAMAEVQYLMVAAADEAFLQFEWAGRTSWLSRPLEAHVWKSHEAGERVFRTLDAVLERRTILPTEVLLVYLHALSIGFRGRHALIDPGAPESYRRRLVKFLRDLGEPLVRQNPALCPDALRHNVTKNARLSLASLSRGALPLAIVIVTWLLLGGLLFQARTTSLGELLDRIEAAR